MKPLLLANVFILMALGSVGFAIENPVSGHALPPTPAAPGPSKPTPTPVTPAPVTPAPVTPAPTKPDEPVATEKPTDWQDPVTGWHYMFLPTKRTFIRASMACGNRGWSLFNLMYLSKEEQDRFYASPIYQAIPWKTRFVGEPGEISEAGYWNSSEISDAGSSATATLLKRLKVENKTRQEIGYMDANKIDDSTQESVICMYRGETWFNCSLRQDCVLSGWSHPPGGTPFEYPYGTLSSTYSESGVTKDEAVKRILAKSNFSTPQEWKVHKTCQADLESLRCNQEH